MTDETGTNTFLRWAGSKRKSVMALRRYWNSEYERYVEPFAGSAVLFFQIQPANALLCDINTDLINTYRQVRSNLNEVMSHLRYMRKGEASYYRIRSLDPRCLVPSKRAARFIYLNRYCFNGLYRTNLAGGFNVPYGGEKSGALPKRSEFLKCSQVLKRARIKRADFEETLKSVYIGDLVYMDPPFRVKSTRVFNEYDAATFDEQKLDALRKWMVELNRKGIAFLVSYAECEEADFLANGFNIERVSVKRNIAGFAADRRTAMEYLISNRDPGQD